MERSLSLLIFVLVISIGSAQTNAINFNGGSLKKTLKEARKQKRTVVLDFYADWCLPCKQMEKVTFSDPEVIEHFNKNHVIYRVDVDQFAGMDIAEKYRVNKYPTLIFLDRKGKERLKTTGFKGAGELMDLARSVAGQASKR